MNPFELDTDTCGDFPSIDYENPESLSDDVQDVIQWQHQQDRNKALGL